MIISTKSDNFKVNNHKQY